MAKVKVELPTLDYYRQYINCQWACPAMTNIPRYLKLIRAGRYTESYALNRKTNVFPHLLGRVCVRPCQDWCRRKDLDRTVAICWEKRAAADNMDLDELEALLEKPKPPRPEKVAIVGAGPSGLTVANDLALLGYSCTVFEALPEPGGMFRFGIPEFRLPRDLIRFEIGLIEKLGVEIRCNVNVGTDVTLDELLEQYDAVSLNCGAQGSRRLDVPNEDGPGYWPGLRYIVSVCKGEDVRVGRSIAIIGGGLVAMDCVRSAVRLQHAQHPDAERRTFFITLETRAETPAGEHDIEECEEEGITHYPSRGVKELVRDADGRVVGLTTLTCSSVFDEQGRFNPTLEPGTEESFECDTVITAIGQVPNMTVIGGYEDRLLDERKRIAIDGDYMTRVPGVFAGSDFIFGPREIITCIGEGHRIARGIHKHLATKAANLPRQLRDEEKFAFTDEKIDLYEWRYDTQYHPQPQQPMPTCDPVGRRRLDVEVERGYSRPTADDEADRCLNCDVYPVFIAERCILCGGCTIVCPERCLTLVDLTQIEITPEVGGLLETQFGADAAQLKERWGEVSVMLKDDEVCIRCALCEEICPTEAWTLEMLRERPCDLEDKVVPKRLKKEDGRLVPV